MKGPMMAGNEHTELKSLTRDLRAAIDTFGTLAVSLQRCVLDRTHSPEDYTRLLATQALTRLVLERGHGGMMTVDKAILYELAERLIDPTCKIRQHHKWFQDRSGRKVTRSAFYRFAKRYDLAVDAVMRGRPLGTPVDHDYVPDLSKDRPHGNTGNRPGR